MKDFLIYYVAGLIFSLAFLAVPGGMILYLVTFDPLWLLVSVAAILLFLR